MPAAKMPASKLAGAKAPNFKRLIPLGGVVLLLTTALLFWAHDVIREVIVLPLSHLFYFLRLFVSTTPQIFFWFGLLALLLVAAWRRVAARPKVLMDVPLAMHESDWSGGRVEGRAAFWSSKVALLRNGQAGGYYQRSFQNALGRLLVDVLAYRYHLAPNQVEDRLRDGSLDVPPEIREYALNALRREEISRQMAWIEWWEGTFGSLRNKIAHRLRAVLASTGLFSAAKNTAGAQSPARRWKPEPPVDPHLARVLAYMKEELEVPNDDSGR